MYLIYKDTLKPVKKGDVLTSFRGEKYIAEYFSEPTHGEGKIFAHNDNGVSGEYYASVFGLEWVDKPLYIRETGQYFASFFDDAPMWQINTSAILTRLIQYAGEICTSYASDLFILWKYNIEAHLTERDWKGEELILGFREMGVDKNENVMENRNRYSRIVSIKTRVSNGIMEMVMEVIK